MQLTARRPGDRAIPLRSALRHVYRETNSSRADCHLELFVALAENRPLRTSSRAIGLPQSGRSCSEVEGELHVARGEIERNKVTGGVAVMAVVQDHAVRRGRF